MTEILTTALTLKQVNLKRRLEREEAEVRFFFSEPKLDNSESHKVQYPKDSQQ